MVKLKTIFITGLFIVWSSCFASDLQLSIYNLKAEVQDGALKLKCYESELNLLNDRMTDSEQLIQQLSKHIKKPANKVNDIELEKLKVQIQELQHKLHICTSKIDNLGALIACDISELKKTLRLICDHVDASDSKIYVVQAGDTLSHIAQKHNTTLLTLKTHNKLSNDQIQIGQKLLIPT